MLDASLDVNRHRVQKPWLCTQFPLNVNIISSSYSVCKFYMQHSNDIWLLCAEF